MGGRGPASAQGGAGVVPEETAVGFHIHQLPEP